MLMERMGMEEALSLPLALVYQLEHCAMIHAGRKCSFATDVGGELEDLFNAFRDCHTAPSK